MAYNKGERIERGIWRLKDSEDYLAEVYVTDPDTQRLLRLRKTTHLLKLARD